MTDYPKEIKAFYMKMNEDGKTVAAVDCLVPGIGEIIGGEERTTTTSFWHVSTSWDFTRRIMSSISISESTVPQDMGFGLGFERCVMYLTGMSNIRDVIPFPRTVNNCEL